MTESSTPRPKDFWERRREEPPNAHYAFQCYLELPPERRTLKEAYRVYTGNDDAAAPSDNFKGWAKRHDWLERALAWDDAKAKARRDGELAGIGSQWEQMAAQKEKMLGQLFDLMQLSYEKAKEIFAQELTKDNYSMAHAIQIVKLMGESIKLATELEKVYKEAAGNAWTEEDERNLADAMEELRADEAAEFFEEETRRKKEEEERGSEGAGDAST